MDSKHLILRGGRPLHGHVRIAGAKNAATKMMVASLLTHEPVTLRNLPHIQDVDITAELLGHLGTKTTRREGEITLHTPSVTSTTVAGLSRSNRLSILTLAPLLHRTGEAKVPTVGGDEIGPRPVDFHLQALQQMGARLEQGTDGYEARAERLKGAAIALPYPSVGATESVIFGAVLAEGRTRLTNAAVEPEIVDLVKLLQRMGAIIEFGANRTLTIDGVERLHGVTYDILPDRLEAASYALAALATDGEIRVEGARQDEMMTFLNTVRRMGADYVVETDAITFRRSSTGLKAIELETDTYPGFSTDWQQPTVVALTQARGLSVVHETVYEDRFGYTQDLVRMGADIGVFAKCLGELHCRFHARGMRHSAVIKGGTPLHGAEIEIPDIRAGMAQVIAALVAPDTSRLSGVHHLERGYEHFEDKLRSIGADFEIKEA